MRALMAALVLGGCAGEPLFVDQVEDGRAVLIDAHGKVQHVPADVLGGDAGEGMWLGAPPDLDQPAQIAALRASLSASDDGGDLVLP
ncbi:MAG: hypothetical protein JST54_02080 [Deltaproteobacteria bacterium]|nr:hypothetical protein [Deltaproteobacteria bacterium]